MFQLFVIEDNRAIFMFSDGSQAWDAKDFLLKQPQVSEVSLEGRQFEGPAHRHSAKQELWSFVPSTHPVHLFYDFFKDVGKLVFHGLF